MHYYTRHLGDYTMSTAHLSMMEHGAYTLLLDQHYATEKPLPADMAILCRILRASGKAETAAIQAVLEQFWTLTETGWVQKRAQEEMLRYAERAVINKATGLRGGRPKKTMQETERITESVTESKTESVSKSLTEHEPNRNPIPITNTNIKPNTPPIRPPSPEKPPPQKRSAAPPGKPGDVLDAVWTDFLAIRKAKRAPLTATALRAIESEAAKAGLSLNAALVECCARGWQGFRADWIGPKPRASPVVSLAERRGQDKRDFWEQINGKTGAVSAAIDGEAVRVD